MKIKWILTIAVSFFISQFVYGQNDSNKKHNALALSVGLDNISLKDQTFSPSVFSGNIPNLSLGFSRNIRDQKLLNTFISVSVGDIDYKNQYFTSTYYSAQFSFNYLWKINSYGQSKIFLGGQFGSILNLLDYDGFVSASWFTALQLAPVLIYSYDISEKHSISGQFSHPIMNLVSRPSYAGIDEFVVINTENVPRILYSRLKLYSLNKLINPNLELKYSYELQKSVFSISANYSYLQVNSIRKYYKNSLGFNLMFQIKIGK